MSDQEKRLLEIVMRVALEYKLTDEETRILVGQVLAGDIVLKLNSIGRGEVLCKGIINKDIF